jgi:arginine/serine-rich splicing factor 4/5/6
VEFDDVRDAEDAIHEMNGERLCGDRITVELAKGTVAELQYGLSSLSTKKRV